MKNKCPICEGTGKLDDAQAWDCGQEPSDCPYCYTYQRGLSEGRKQGLREVVEVLVRLGYLKGDKLIDAIKPRHGNCCTCQTCGHEQDDCVCAHNELLKAIEAALEKVEKPKEAK